MERRDTDEIEMDEMRLLTDREVAFVQGRSLQSVRNDRYVGRGPRWVRVGRLVRYRKSDVTSFLRSLTNDLGASPEIRRSNRELSGVVVGTKNNQPVAPGRPK